MMTTSRINPQQEVLFLEKGSIYFFFRPQEKPLSEPVIQAKIPAEVQHFYLVLHPENSSLYRLVLMGHKTLPTLEEGHRKIWARVETVDNSGETLLRELQEKRYILKTGGEQLLPTFEASDEGKYEMTFYDDHTHLTYEIMKLQHYKKASPLPFHIKPKASYLIFVKNPMKDRNLNHSPPNFSDFLLKKFNDTNLIPLNPIDFLNYPDTELLIISSLEQHNS